jgi:hypothetical protein
MDLNEIKIHMSLGRLEESRRIHVLLKRTAEILKRDADRETASSAEAFALQMEHRE